MGPRIKSEGDGFVASIKSSAVMLGLDPSIHGATRVDFASTTPAVKLS